MEQNNNQTEVNQKKRGRLAVLADTIIGGLVGLVAGVAATAFVCDLACVAGDTPHDLGMLAAFGLGPAIALTIAGGAIGYTGGYRSWFGNYSQNPEQRS